MDQELEKNIQWILQEKYGGSPSSRLRQTKAKKDIERLKNGEPLDHIIGFTDFLGCKILVNKNVLIPRVETEFWVEKAIEEMSLNNTSLYKQGTSVLDMFAGSGCIGISIMRHIKSAKVVFVESEKEAVVQIKINCKVNKINAKRYKIIQSDIFENVGVQKFDYIFANPPYIPLTKKKSIQKSVVDYEPHVALFGGKAGMFFIRKFLAEAKNFLNPGGKIYMEFDTTQKRAIYQFIKKLKYKKWDFHRDQYGKVRYVVVQ